MVLLVAVIVGLIIGLVSGGAFSGFSAAAARFRLFPLMIAAAVVQVVIFTAPIGKYDIIHRIGPYIYMATLLATLYFLFSNRNIPGLKIIMFGAALNAIVIFANVGFMPAPESALRDAGRYDHVVQSQADIDAGKRIPHTNSKVVTGDYSYVLDADAPLLFLGDVFAIPERYPFANVISIGDLFIAFGAGFAVVKVMHFKRREEESGVEQMTEVEHTTSG